LVQGADTGGRGRRELGDLLDMRCVPSEYNTTWFVFLLRMHKRNPDSHCKTGPKTIFLHPNKPHDENAQRYLYHLSACMPS